MTSNAHSQVVQKQFGEQASAYLSSAVHAQGTEFALLQAELAGQGEARVLDLGCGAGHVSFHVAPLVKEVVKRSRVARITPISIPSSNSVYVLPRTCIPLRLPLLSTRKP